MVPEEIGPFATTDYTLHLLHPAHKVEAEPDAGGVWITLESRRHWSGVESARLHIKMPIETALKLYATLGDAIDKAVQRNGTAPVVTEHA